MLASTEYKHSFHVRPSSPSKGYVFTEWRAPPKPFYGECPGGHVTLELRVSSTMATAIAIRIRDISCDSPPPDRQRRGVAIPASPGAAYSTACIASAR